MKYGTWNVSGCDSSAEQALQKAGISPLTAAVLCSRGYDSAAKVHAFLSSGSGSLYDPFLLPDMDRAAARVRKAIDTNEYIAVYGDYDVDGITATCLLTDFLRTQGARCRSYIPGRIEEGYGLNETAVRQLAGEGVTLIVTVDCGITAVEEAALCAALGIDLVITDHHECRDALPEAAAVVDPHRRDSLYPFTPLAGVGVAFKLAAAILGDQTRLLARYADFVCLGTVADVMPLLDENRIFVTEGVTALQTPSRVGIRALIEACGCSGKAVTASTIGYILAPRINAAGRMGQVELAYELFLTEDPARAAELADGLCRLNRLRQSVEGEIYADAAARLSHTSNEGAIVLSGEGWHQGVVGIVASRLAEEFGCPTFLICLDGDRGKASSRSFGGFNLFASLEALSNLLENYGGHELAAGFTIRREHIDEFGARVSEMARQFSASGQAVSALPIDCAIEDSSLLTLDNVAALDLLEPCGAGFPRPVFYMGGLRVRQLAEVGGGKHLKLRLEKDGYSFSAIFFSMTAPKSAVAEGDIVEIAFTPQVNEFRGAKSVQLSLVDIRPDAATRAADAQARDLYRKHKSGLPLTPYEADVLLPPRTEFVAVWRYLTAHSRSGALCENLGCMSRKIARTAGIECSVVRTRICLDVFRERGLISVDDRPWDMQILLTDAGKKVNLDSSGILIRLRAQKGEA